MGRRTPPQLPQSPAPVPRGKQDLTGWSEERISQDRHCAPGKEEVASSDTAPVPSFTSVLMESSGQLSPTRCVDPGLRAGLLVGLEVRKAWPRLWQRLMLHIPSAVPSSSPALSLFLTPSGSRATRQRHPVPAPDSRTLRHTLAARPDTRPGLLEPPKGLASATAHSWASPGHS